MNDALKIVLVLLVIGSLGVALLVVFPLFLLWAIKQDVTTLRAKRPEYNFVSSGDTFQDAKKLGTLVKEWEMYIPSDKAKYTRDKITGFQDEQTYQVLRYFHSTGRVVKLVDHRIN